MLDRWIAPGRSSGRVVVTRTCHASEAERRLALSPDAAVWELSDGLGDPFARHRLCELYEGCVGGSANLALRPTDELGREIAARIAAGSLLVIPLVEEQVAVIALRGVGEVPAPKGGEPEPAVEDPVTVAIKASDGASDPPRHVALGKSIELKGVPSRGAGAYRWSAAAVDGVTLEHPTAHTVVVKAAEDAAAGATVAVTLEFTPSGKPALAPVSHDVAVAAVAFSADPDHPWGYDAYEELNGVDKDGNETTPKPGPALDFVSVKVGEVGKVRITLGGVDPPSVFLRSTAAAKCKPKVEHPASDAGTLELDGVAAGEARIEAHLDGPAGPLLGQLGVSVLEEKTFEAEVFCVEDPGSAGTALATRPTGADVQRELGAYYRQAVGAWEVSGDGAAVEVAYDLNHNDMLDMEPDTTTAEQRAIIDACPSEVTRVIVVNRLRWRFMLARSAKAADTRIKLKPYASLEFIGKRAYRFEDEAGHAVVAPKVKHVNKATGWIELEGALGVDLDVADKAALIFPLGGLSGNPLWIGIATVGDPYNYIAHELGHTRGKWKDVCERDNLMHGGSDEGTKLRHRPIARYYHPTQDEQQWKRMPRT